MSIRQPRYSKEEITRRGNEIYSRTISPQIETRAEGKFVALDMETGKWELDAMLSVRATA